jgi:cardiolipin synthase
MKLYWLAACFIVFYIQLLWIICREYRYPARTVTWLLVQFICPGIGFMVYLIIRKPYPHHRSHTRTTSIVTDNGDHSSKLTAYLLQLPGSSFPANNQVHIFTNSEDCFQAMLREIERATSHIHFQFYTIRHDQIGRRFEDALIQKAKQGLKVRVVFDRVGSHPLSSAFLKKMKRSGIEIYAFLPIWPGKFLRKINYRNHRKVVVLDGKVGFMGGMNIGDEYLGGNANLGFWRDTHIQTEGSSVHQLQSIFMQDWFLATNQLLEAKDYYPSCDGGHAKVQLIESGPDLLEDRIRELFFTMIISAKKSIYISTPYFIPDPSIRFALKTSAMSGLDVRIILPEKIDSSFTRYATHSFVEELLLAGVHVYFYQKGFMHAKVMIIDDTHATVGSANMDPRSFYYNFEIVAMFFGSQEVSKLTADYHRDLNESIPIHMDMFGQRSRGARCKEVIARLLSSFM